MTEGHTVGNHTWSHPCMVDLDTDALAFQVAATSNAISDITGQAPHLLRPPYGSRTSSQLDWYAAHDLRVVLWDLDSRDWSRPGSDTITRNVLDHTCDGSVILLHDGGGDRSQTAGALPSIVEGLTERGYQMVTLAQE
jgi:peptidoglycan-N-acetylglucosamine deacetylase